MSANRRIPFFVPDIGEAAIARVADALRSGWLTSGPRTSEFEAAFADAVGAKHAVAVNSGTAALHLALVANDVGPGDEVIVPTMTFAATVEVVVHTGAKPVLVDVNPGDLNLDPLAVEHAISPRTKAIMPIHYGGHPARMDAVMQLAERHGLVVIEDAAHAFPARYHGQMVGTIGDATCFSFYANKTITTGEGGMVTTADPAIAKRIRSLSLHGLSTDAWNRYSSGGSWDYSVVAAGFKYNLTDIAACLGLDQLTRADGFAAARQRVAYLYDELFSESALVAPLEVSGGIKHAHHLYVVRLNLAALSRNRNWVIEELRARDIATSVHYRPIHMHQYYRNALEHEPTDFPVAAAAFDEIISLPIYPLMTDHDVEYVAAVLLDTLSDIRRP